MEPKRFDGPTREAWLHWVTWPVAFSQAAPTESLRMGLWSWGAAVQRAALRASAGPDALAWLALVIWQGDDSAASPTGFRGTGGSLWVKVPRRAGSGKPFAGRIWRCPGSGRCSCND